MSENLREFPTSSEMLTRLNELRPGGGGGDNTDMEQRIASIERRLQGVETTVQHIDKQVSEFKWWVAGQIVAGIVTIIGTGVAIQQMTVSTFQAAAQQTQAPQQPAPIVITVPPPAQPASR